MLNERVENITIDFYLFNKKVCIHQVEVMKVELSHLQAMCQEDNFGIG